MADEVSGTPGPFDVERIKVLVGLMRKHDLTEIDLHDGTMRIRLRRGLPESGTPLLTAPAAAALAQPAPATPPAARSADGADSAKPGKKLVEIKAQTPGIFYAKPSPDDEPYVRVGSRVLPNTVVCLIEAMKLYNEIQAECSGVIAEILVENGQSVEYNQVLFRVDPTG
ncbi:MAG: acetyl-CoA carboxylase biotin carboxyl carrier protein [Gemmataceae bacterium]|nr:acetyl-CoA carboxylase biotin carboxyl carrier protein [Gemmataceae bacterium]